MHTVLMTEKHITYMTLTRGGGGAVALRPDKCDGFTSFHVNTCKTSLCNNFEPYELTYVPVVCTLPLVLVCNHHTAIKLC